MGFCRSHFAVYFNFTWDQLIFSNDKLRSSQLHPSVTWNMEGSNWRKMLPMDFECKACVGFSLVSVVTSSDFMSTSPVTTPSMAYCIHLHMVHSLASLLWLLCDLQSGYDDPGTPGSRVSRLPTWVVAVVILSLGLVSLGLSGKNLGLGQDESSSTPHHSARFPW